MKWLKKLFGGDDEKNGSGGESSIQDNSSKEAIAPIDDGGINIPDVQWLAPTDNPWDVPVLDVRPVTLGLTSVSQDPQCASNAISFRGDDGTGFIGIPPIFSRTTAANLRYPIDRVLADGALYIPSEMEHKWAIYFHQGKIIFIRSWLRQVWMVADVEQHGDHIIVTSVDGILTDPSEDPDMTVRGADFLIRSHALDMIIPAPIPAGKEESPRQAALWCMSTYGNRAQFATPHAYDPPTPEIPLRTHSLLHIAIARGDTETAGEMLDRGIPVDLLARDGLTPLHWGLAYQDTSMLKFLLERGSPADVRSGQGATPLMNALQGQSMEKMIFLLDQGADPNAADHRGFTSLHRAAEMGMIDFARVLLERGAKPDPVAQGQTPRSLAEKYGQMEMVKLLDTWNA